MSRSSHTTIVSDDDSCADSVGSSLWVWVDVLCEVEQRGKVPRVVAHLVAALQVGHRGLKCEERKDP